MGTFRVTIVLPGSVVPLSSAGNIVFRDHLNAFVPCQAGVELVIKSSETSPYVVQSSAARFASI